MLRLVWTMLDINGYTGQVTNQQLIAMVTESGGQVRRILSGSCTHVVTAMPLSGSKTQKELLRKRSGIPIVRPEWVIESIKAGKRQAEWKYPVMLQEVSVSQVLEPGLRIGFKPFTFLRTQRKKMFALLLDLVDPTTDLFSFWKRTCDSS